MLKSLLGSLFLAAALLLHAAPMATAQVVAEPPDPSASREATGGAQTLEDILRRQRGEEVPLDQGQAGPAPLPEDAPGALATQGGASSSALWRGIRQGETFTVSIPDKKAARLVQDEGESWLSMRNGTLVKYTGWAFAGILGLLALFMLLRGRIRIDGGLSGIKIERFDFIERFAHWLLAISFIVLAVTGFALLVGRQALAWLNTRINGENAQEGWGMETFASLIALGKWAHNHLSWAFIVAIVLIFILWVFRNIPTWTDVKWFAKGGGLFSKHSHPDAKKFNGGQKLIFWSVVLLGGSLSASGIALMFPFEYQMFAPSFAKVNEVGTAVGYDPQLATELTAMQEQQYAHLWHVIVAIILSVIIVAHIYIGSIGMQGAFAAMGSGEVDLNWAREHHNLWVEDLERRGELTDRDKGVVRTQPVNYGRHTPAE